MHAKVFIEINFFVDKTFVIDCTADDNIFKDKKKKKYLPSFLFYYIGALKLVTVSSNREEQCFHDFFIPGR